MPLKKLPAIAAKVDAELIAIEQEVDWLHYLSPTNNDAVWETFKNSDYAIEPILRYPDIPDDFAGLKERLRKLPVDDVEEPLLHALFSEKKLELELQVELVLMRDSPGFVAISVELFGEAEPTLLHSAKEILAKAPAEPGPDDTATCDDIVNAAHEELIYYRNEAPDLKARIDVLDDLNSMMMVHHGHLKVAKSVKLPPQRIAPLVAHEVGTHVVTRYNGWCQPIQLLEVGLAHYDPLQEGLGTLAEYLAGYLPPRRLRVIAARVVATELAMQRKGVCDIFHCLHDEYSIPKMDAFDTAVRACRGGGLTKDSVYLRGLIELLAYLNDGGDMELLHLGKFALGQRRVVEELLDEGWLLPPKLIPRHLRSEKGRERLQRVRNLSIENLFQREPEL